MSRRGLVVMLVIASGFLVWCAGAWAYAFYKILQDGYVRFYEPSMLVLITEFTTAVVLTLTGVAFITLIVVKEAKRR